MVGFANGILTIVRYVVFELAKFLLLLLEMVERFLKKTNI